MHSEKTHLCRHTIHFDVSTGKVGELCALAPQNGRVYEHSAVLTVETVAEGNGGAYRKCTPIKPVMQKYRHQVRQATAKGRI